MTASIRLSIVQKNQTKAYRISQRMRKWSEESSGEATELMGLGELGFGDGILFFEVSRPLEITPAFEAFLYFLFFLRRVDGFFCWNVTQHL